MAPRSVNDYKFHKRLDGVWVTKVDTGRINPNGTRDRRQVGSRDLSTAKRKLRELLRQINANALPLPGSQRMTLARWAEVWLPMHAAKVRPRTYSTDVGAVRKWIVPTLGHRKLADLTPADLRALTKAITDAGRSTTTALHAHKILRKMLKDAEQEGHEVPARIFKADLPGKSANDRGAMPLDELGRVLEAAGRRDDSARWVLALLYGVRQGEALGLSWDRVTDANIDLTWQLQHLPKAHTTPDGWKARHIVGRAWWVQPKTKAGARILPLLPFMQSILAAARATWEPNPWGLLWVQDGLPIRADVDRATWHAIQAEAGVAHPSGRPWLLHECRHSAATLLKQAGASDQLVAAILGQETLVQSYIHAGDPAEMLRVLGASADILGLTEIGA